MERNVLQSEAVELARRARETGLFAVLESSGALMAAGPDAANFLHAQLTNEVNALKPGEGNLSARSSRTGTLLRYFSLHKLPTDPAVPVDRFILLLERDGVASLQRDLEKFAIADDVLFEDVSERFHWLLLHGPQAATLAGKAFGKQNGASWTDFAECSVAKLQCDFAPPETLAFTRALAGDAGFIIAIPKSESGAELNQLLARLLPLAIELNFISPSGEQLNAVLEILRVEAGVVRIGIDAKEGERVLPETGLEQQVVSYSKGCYLGQEVIARIRTYGSVPQVLRGLVFEGGSGGVSAPTKDFYGSIELADGTTVGQITSRAFSPMLNAPIAFAYLDRAHRTPGTKLNFKNGLIARVALLPFYRAADTKSRATFLHDRAIRMFADQQDDKALELLEEALRVDPSYADAYEALGVILGRTGRFNEAIGIFKRLEEVAPKEPMVHTNLSLYYMKIGDKTAAEEEKAKATIKQFSKFGSMRKEEELKAEASAKAKADALHRKKMFEEVLEIDAEDPIALFGLGNALSALQEWEDAALVLAKASQIQKDNSPIYLSYGKALEMLNRESEALAVYKAGMAVASKKGDLMPLKEMERRALLLGR